MTDSKRHDRDAERRRPYEPPVIENTAVFETLALSCGKLEGDDSCIYGEGTTNS